MKIILSLKIILLMIILFGIFYILEYGFSFDSTDKLLKPSLLSAITMIMIFKPSFKHYIIFLISICLVLMIISSILNLLRFSNIVGEFGFSLLVITIILYLPQLIKKGHIERV